MNHKTRVEYDSNGVYVSRNKEDYSPDAPDAVFFYAGRRTGQSVVSAQEARDIAAALIAAADSFEALKPPEPRPQVKYEAMLDSLGYGAVLKAKTTNHLYVKFGNDKWYGIDSRENFPNYCFLHYAGHEILFEGVKND